MGGVGGPGASGTLIVLNKAEASASLLDCGTGEEVARLPTGDGPHEVAVSPDGATAVVANYGPRGQPGHTLTVIDVAGRRARSTIDLGSYQRPHGIQFLAGGRQVVVTAEQQKAVLLVDLESAVVVEAVSTGQRLSHMLVLAPDARRAFVSNIMSGNVTVVDLDLAQAVANIETGKGAEGIDISPDGREVWVTNRAEDTISIIDTELLEVVATLPCESFPIRIKFTPDGVHVLVSNARSGDLAVFDAAQRREIRRIPMQQEAVGDTSQRLFRDTFGQGPVPVGILVEPRGRRAFVAGTNADVVAVIDLQKWEVTGYLTAGEEPDGLGHSPIVLAR
ncbi:MAG: YVTN family beta-propeller repeat protein [Planctomycetota bacterium]|jgi:YVTN family beta-propeller protein